MTPEQKEYYDFCRKTQDEHYVHFVRKPGEPPRLGHHVFPTSLGGGGDSDDWEDPNIAPFTPAENYEAHRLQALAWPDDPGVRREWIMCSAKGTIKSAAEFEKYVIKIYDKCKVYTTYVKDLGLHRQVKVW